MIMMNLHHAGHSGHGGETLPAYDSSTVASESSVVERMF